jgi:hypothetical protein
MIVPAVSVWFAGGVKDESGRTEGPSTSARGFFEDTFDD